MKKSSLTLTLVFLMVIVLPFLVIAARIAFNLRFSADDTARPEEVIVSNISDTSVTISWITQNEHPGLVNYSTTAENLSQVARDFRDNTSSGNYKTHYVRIDNLTPNTSYFFEILSGGEKFNNSGSVYTFNTLATSDNLSTPESLIGTIDYNLENAIVYAHAYKNGAVSTPISTHITNSNFALPKSNFKNFDNGDVFDLNEAEIIISVTEETGLRGRETIEAAAERTQDIVLNQNELQYNPNEFRSQTTIFPTVQITPTQPTNNTNPTPSINAPINNIPDSSLISTKVSYGKENSDPTTPFDIFISNISQSGFSVNWLTKEPTVGKVVYSRANSSDKTLLDDRDSSVSQSKRYTHKVTISAGDFDADEVVNFFIYVNEKPIGSNLTQNKFTFRIPEALNSPPLPETISGNVSFDYSPSATRDTLVSARFNNSTSSTSSWLSTSVPAGNNVSWTLPYATVLDTSLEEYFDSESSNFDIAVYGEYNSKAGISVNNNTNPVSIGMVRGLSVRNLEHNKAYPAINTISGTANPNTNVTININSQNIQAQSNSTGEWQTAVIIDQTGTYNMNISTSEEKYGFVFAVNSSSLPNSAITNYIPQFIGIGLVTAGIILYIIIKRSRAKFL